MPTLMEHQSNEYTKCMVIGDSGTGKTGGLTSLVKAGYELRILDMDNGLEPLKTHILRECPEAIQKVRFRTIRDKYKASSTGPVIDGPPKAFVEALKMLDHWRDGEVDLGKPAEWGPNVILGIDSLTLLSNGAFEWAKGLNPGSKDPRPWYGQAQQAIEKTIAWITSETYQTNVIVIAHVKYTENDDGTRKGYPNSIGAALGPIIPRYFNSIALTQTSKGEKRILRTIPTNQIDLKNPKPFEMAKEYPIETGLAEFFEVLRGKPTQIEPKPKLRKVQ